MVHGTTGIDSSNRSVIGEYRPGCIQRVNQNTAADTTVGASRARNELVHHATRRLTSVAGRKMTPSFICTATFRAQPWSGPFTSPVSNPITQLCKGHVTESSCTMPCERGPPLCGHLSHNAKILPLADLKIAMSPWAVAITREPRDGTSSTRPTSIHSVAMIILPPSGSGKSASAQTHGRLCRQRALPRDQLAGKFVSV